MDLSKKIEHLEARIVKLEERLIEHEDNNNNGERSGKHPQISVVEFLREKKPSTAVDKALVFAVYHETQTGKEVFNTEDLLNLWRQAKEARPSNINDLINKNVKKGFMADEKTNKGQKKSWYVTSSGSEIVKSSFHAKQ